MSLAARSTADERMDTDCVDYDDYRRCLRDLARVNTVTLTHRPMLAWLARETAGLQSFSLLDVACGHGDALRRIHRWATQRGLTARLHGVDLNPWATRAARDATDAAASITYRTGDVFAIDAAETFGFIVSSQFTHHLTDESGCDVHPLDGGARTTRLVHWRPASPLAAVLRFRRARLACALASFRTERRPHLDRPRLRAC